MKKMIIGFASVFVLFNAAFAAQAHHAKISQELDAALEIAAEDAKKAAEEEDKRIEALYQKRFKAFEVVGVDKEVKKVIFEQLRKDSNWDIVDVKIRMEEEYNNSFVKIIDSNGKELTVFTSPAYRSPSDAMDWADKRTWLIQTALKYHKDPVLLYEEIQNRAKRQARDAAFAKFQNSFTQYYFELTGKLLPKAPKGCIDMIEVYQMDIPDDRSYYYQVHVKKDGDKEVPGLKEKSYVFYPKDIKPGTYFNFKCYSSIDTYEYGQLPNTFARKWGMFFSSAHMTRHVNGDLVFFKEKRDRDWQDMLNKFELEPLPQKLIKVFKKEDFYNE